MKEKLNDTMQTERTRWGKIAVLTIFLVFLLNFNGYAIWLGQSQVNPFVEVSGMYETNEFRVSGDQEEDNDFITIISPGIHFEMPTVEDSIYRAVANYRTNIKIYGNNGDSDIDPDEELNTIEHRFDSELRFEFASGFKLAGGYDLNITSDAPDFRGDTRDEYVEHHVFTQGGYQFADRYEIQLGYDGTITRYSDSENESMDMTEHALEAIAFYRILSKLSILGGGGYAIIDRKNPYSNSTEYKGFTGARYEATERMTGIVKVGAVSKSFDKDVYDDTTEFFLSGEMNFEQSEMTTIHARIIREFSNSSTYAEYYVTTGVGANISHTLAALPNLTLSGSFDYSRDDYPEFDRSDNNIDVSLGLAYKFAKYIETGATYLYSATNSDDDANDFVDHTAMIRVRFIL